MHSMAGENLGAKAKHYRKYRSKTLQKKNESRKKNVRRNSFIAPSSAYEYHMELLFIEDMRWYDHARYFAKYLEAHKVNSTERERILIRAKKL